MVDISFCIGLAVECDRLDISVLIAVAQSPDGESTSAHLDGSFPWLSRHGIEIYDMECSGRKNHADDPCRRNEIVDERRI